MLQSEIAPQLAACDDGPNPLRFNTHKRALELSEDLVHVYGRKGNYVCETDTRGYAQPDNRDPLDLVVHASDGFIPLWAPGVTLRWRFQPSAMTIFRDPDAAADYIRALFGQGILEWGDAAPIRFTEAADRWDFEIVPLRNKNCSDRGCTLARAFFPDSGQHELQLFPTLWEQSQQEQVETMAHEIGHIFGLRHFFAKIHETAWPAEIFGNHRPFSIMNYGEHSVMTETDQEDLKQLYFFVWSGQLPEINGTEVRQFQPFSALQTPVPVPAMVQPRLAASRSYQSA